MPEHSAPTPRPLAVTAGQAVLHAERWTGPPGAPTAVLLHPGVSDRRCWREVAARLAAQTSVVIYDRRGFGETPPATTPFSHLDDLVAVLNAATDGPVWLVGSSAGGQIALDAALLHPDRVAGMVLLAPAVTGAPPPALDRATERLDELQEAATQAGDLDAINRFDVWVWLDGPAQPEGRVGGAARELERMMNAIVVRNENASPNLAQPASTDAWNRLDQVRHPTTIICGDLDVPFLCDRSAELAHRLSRGRLEILPGTAHLPFLEEPLRVADLILDAITTPSPA